MFKSTAELEALVRAGIRHAQDDHHRLCGSRSSRECDCYYRSSATSHDALTELVRRAK